MKNKTITSALAFFGGSIGTHRFYLGQKILGITNIILFASLLVVSIEEHIPLLFIPFILGFLDGVLFGVMHPDEFNLKYNNTPLKSIKNNITEKIIAEEHEETPYEQLLVDNHTTDYLSQTKKTSTLLEQLNKIKNLKEEDVITSEEVELLKKRYL